MTLYEKVVALYPELIVDNSNECPFSNCVIMLQNDLDGRGDYIAKWEHPTLARPTQEQLDSVSGE